MFSDSWVCKDWCSEHGFEPCDIIIELFTSCWLTGRDIALSDYQKQAQAVFSVLSLYFRSKKQHSKCLRASNSIIWSRIHAGPDRWENTTWKKSFVMQRQDLWIQSNFLKFDPNIKFEQTVCSLVFTTRPYKDIPILRKLKLRVINNKTVTTTCMLALIGSPQVSSRCLIVVQLVLY